MLNVQLIKKSILGSFVGLILLGLSPIQSHATGFLGNLGKGLGMGLGAGVGFGVGESLMHPYGYSPYYGGIGLGYGGLGYGGMGYGGMGYGGMAMGYQPQVIGQMAVYSPYMVNSSMYPGMYPGVMGGSFGFGGGFGGGFSGRAW